MSSALSSLRTTTRQTLLAIAFLASPIAPAAASENIGQVKQPIIAGHPVDAATQKARGLVAIRSPAGSCSGTLINQFWVLTADHCITQDGKFAGPGLPPSAFTISAVWSAARPVPTRIERLGIGRSRDVALIFLGATDFGPAPTQELAQRAVTDDSTILKYGRGVSAYAKAGSPPVPSTSDGQYRQANMLVGDVGAGVYTVEMNGTGQQAAGGDSGGPDWVVAPGGRSIVWIAGVTSRCQAEYLDGMPQNWNWVVDLGDCTSAGIWDMRAEILEIVEPLSVGFCKDYAARAVAASQENSRLMCGGAGPRWSAAQTEHLNWCIGNRLNTDPANEESRARAETLQNCVASRCDTYAALAISAANENLSKNCGAGGERWTTDRSRHVDWCMKIRGDSAALNAETDARNAELQTCRQNLQLKRAAEKSPSVLIGAQPKLSGAAISAKNVPMLSPEIYCASYADKAVAAAQENMSLNCGGVGGRWTPDRQRHVDWCMGLNGDSTAPTAEAAARDSALAACKAAREAAPPEAPPVEEPAADPDAAAAANEPQ